MGVLDCLPLEILHWTLNLLDLKSLSRVSHASLQGKRMVESAIISRSYRVCTAYVESSGPGGPDPYLFSHCTSQYSVFWGLCLLRGVRRVPITSDLRAMLLRMSAPKPCSMGYSIPKGEEMFWSHPKRSEASSNSTQYPGLLFNKPVSPSSMPIFCQCQACKKACDHANTGRWSLWTRWIPFPVQALVTEQCENIIYSNGFTKRLSSH